MKVEIGPEATQFPEKEYLNGCSAQCTDYLRQSFSIKNTLFCYTWLRAQLDCIKSKNNMPHENAFCEAGPGTSSRKLSMTPIWSWSINFKTDEYCRQLHLEVSERNTLPTLKVSGSNPHGDGNKKMSAIIKED